ncbi:MAG: PAS domain-containing protein [Alphaproteobacteria bacterium]|nr:PAS domain-containing protein [Alphaproteobacteria bacterium]
MAKYDFKPTGKERTFGEDEVIVSKTDTKGKITYGNEVFLRIAGYPESEIVGAPHSILRHPWMPRSVFKLLWNKIEAGDEIFAYVVNMARGGDHYWVFAHVTPTFGADGKIVGYHSNRRKPKPDQIQAASGLYKQLLDIEERASDRKVGMEQAYEHLNGLLKSKGISYDEFVFSI